MLSQYYPFSYVFVTNLTSSDSITRQLNCLRDLAKSVSLHILDLDETIASDLKSAWDRYFHRALFHPVTFQIIEADVNKSLIYAVADQ
jgi:hypothetical protein